MKVNTDGVLLGAWAPVDNAHVVWDVGCGTGVIGLMIAQRCQASVIGIEIDAEAADEAALNFDASPWRSRLSVCCSDINTCFTSLPAPDLIVSNPPFFNVATHGLESPELRRKMARHESSLGFERLIAIAQNSLKPSGKLCFIAPSDRDAEIEWAAAIHKLNIESKASVATRAGKACKRTLWCLRREAVMTELTRLNIRDVDNEYSSDFINLVTDFYINL